jgi:TRAP-type C4-dicarboxylate transport system permease small subunit
MNLVAALDRLTGWASQGLARLGAIAMILMVLHVVADVTGRFFLNAPIEGTLETVAIYYMVMVTVLPFAYVTRSQGQINVVLFTQRLAPRRVALTEACVGLLTLLYMALFTWKTGEEAVNKTLIGEVKGAGDSFILAWPTRWFLPVGAAVMTVAVCLRVVRDFQSVSKPQGAAS